MSEEANFFSTIRSIPPDRIGGGKSCLEDNKNSLIDALHNKDVETINEGILLVLITDTRILFVEIIHKGIYIKEIINLRILIVLQTGSSSSQSLPGGMDRFVFVLIL